MYGLVDGNNFFVSCERVFDRTLVGKPVAVLSSNDGCCVARSNEFKALGISMGTPYFQLKDREATGEVIFRSSNFELYSDLSMRLISILRESATNVEQYSIDEAFIRPPEKDLFKYGVNLRKKLLRWVGIPCGIGFAPTKTLAKIADHIAKKRPEGVYVLPNDPSDILTATPVEEVWGVGRHLCPKLGAEHIATAKDLRDAPDDLLKSIGGVGLLKTALELRGTAAFDERDYNDDPDSISCSRAFGTPVTTREGISESLATYAEQAAEKMRRHKMLASGCSFYAQIFQSGGGGDCVSRTVIFPEPTDATNKILKAISPEIDSLFKEGLRYRKTGIMFFGLEKAGTARQLDLFKTVNSIESSALYKTIDALNDRYGNNKVFSAASGIGHASWHLSHKKRSLRASTRWDELITAR